MKVTDHGGEPDVSEHPTHVQQVQTKHILSVSSDQVGRERRMGSESTDTDDMTEHVPLVSRQSRRSKRLSDDNKRRNHRATSRSTNLPDAKTNLRETGLDTSSDPSELSPNRIKKLREDQTISPHRERPSSKQCLKQ